MARKINAIVPGVIGRCVITMKWVAFVFTAAALTRKYQRLSFLALYFVLFVYAILLTSIAMNIIESVLLSTTLYVKQTVWRVSDVTHFRKSISKFFSRITLFKVATGSEASARMNNIPIIIN